MSQDLIHFVFGDEPYLIEDAVKTLAQPFAQFERYSPGESIDLATLFQAVSTVSLFATPKLIILRNPSFLSDTLSDDDLTQWSLIVQGVRQQGHALIIYLLNRKLDQRKKMFSMLKKNAQLHEFLAFKDWEQDKIVGFIQKKVREQGKLIQSDAAFALEAIGGGQLQILAHEINKLVVYVGEATQITLADVRSLHAGQLASFYDLSQAMQLGQWSKMVQLIELLMQQQEDPIKILGALAANFRLYLQILLLDSGRKSIDEIGRQTGKNPYFIKRILSDIRKPYSVQRLCRFMNAVAQADLDIKSGVMRPMDALSVLSVALVAQ